jgi:hypothetical protein
MGSGNGDQPDSSAARRTALLRLEQSEIAVALVLTTPESSPSAAGAQDSVGLGRNIHELDVDHVDGGRDSDAARLDRHVEELLGELVRFGQRLRPHLGRQSVSACLVVTDREPQATRSGFRGPGRGWR